MPFHRNGGGEREVRGREVARTQETIFSTQRRPAVRREREVVRRRREAEGREVGEEEGWGEGLVLGEEEEEDEEEDG